MFKNLFNKQKKQDAKQFDLNKVYPIIKGRTSNPNATSVNNVEEPINRRITDNVSIYYGIDEGDHLKYVNKSSLKDFNKSDDELHQIALANFAEYVKSKGINVEGDENIQMIKLDQTMDSSLLLYNELWNKFCSDYNDDIVISIPSRELILMSLASNRTGLELLMKGAEDLYSSGQYKLTPELFIRRRDGTLKVLK